MSRLFRDYYKTEQARAALDALKADKEKEHADMFNRWKKLRADYQDALANASDQTWSPEAREKQKKLAEDKRNEVRKSETALSDYETAAQTTYAEQSERVTKRIVEEIRSVLAAKAKAAGWNLVLDVSAVGATGVPMVLYHQNPDGDLTQPVLDQLNAVAAAPAQGQPGKSKP